MPQLVSASDRLAANALLLTQQHVSFVIGPAIAGAVSAAWSPAAAIGLDALSFAFLGVMMLTIRAEAPGPEMVHGGTFRRLRRYPGIALLLGITWLFYMLYGPVEVALPLFVDRHLDGGAATLGFLWAGFGIGAAAGGAATPLLRRSPLWTAVVAIVLGWGMGMVVLAFTTTAWQAGAAMLASGAIFGPYAAVTTTAIQRDARAQDLPPLNAIWASAIVGAAPAGAILGGPLVDRLGADGALLASGAATVALGLAAAAARARRPSDNTLVGA